MNTIWKDKGKAISKSGDFLRTRDRIKNFFNF